MITRKLALGFILLANFILLAHIAVPHHHHHLQICFASDSCSHQQASERHDAANSDCACPCASHSGAGHSGSENPGHHHANSCSLGEFVPASQNHTFRLSHFVSLGHSPLHLPLFLLPGTECKVAAPVRIVQAEHWPPLTRLYRSVAYASSGLRAPPIV